MTAQDQLAMERVPEARKHARPPASGPKSILLHLQDDESVDIRLESALSIARACSAHIECLHITPIEAYVAFDSFGGVFVMNDVIKALDDRETELRSRVEGKLRTEDVSWDYTQVTGNVASRLVSHGALADLVVTGRTPHRSDFVGSTTGLLGDLIFRSRTPLFVPSQEGPPCDPTGSALIAWDNSYEAANAVRASVGLLKFASDVQILKIEEKNEELFPSTRLLEYLSRHGIHAELSVEPVETTKRDQANISGMLMARARANNSYLIMGGYNHSRIGEYIFGGVTQTMISSALVPLLIAR